MGYVEIVTIQLDRERQFPVSFGTIRRFQRKTGKTFKQLADMLASVQADDPNVDEGDVIDLLGALIWAGCVSEDEYLTLDQVFDNLAMDPTAQLEPVFEAITRAMPQVTDDSPLVNGTGPSPSVRKGGSRSGRSRG